jgi:acetamidase/formamidase
LAHRRVEPAADVFAESLSEGVAHHLEEDFEAIITVAAGATVVVRVVDGNDRQIDNAEQGPPDRQRIIDGIVKTPLPGQMLRLDVVRVTAR